MSASYELDFNFEPPNMNASEPNYLTILDKGGNTFQDGLVDATLSVSDNTDFPISAKIITVLYDGDKTVSMGIDEIYSSPNYDSDIRYKLDYNKFELNKTYNLKIFIWNNKSQIMPISNVISKNITFY